MVLQQPRPSQLSGPAHLHQNANGADHVTACLRVLTVPGEARLRKHLDRKNNERALLFSTSVRSVNNFVQFGRVEWTVLYSISMRYYWLWISKPIGTFRGIRIQKLRLSDFFCDTVAVVFFCLIKNNNNNNKSKFIRKSSRFFGEAGWSKGSHDGLCLKVKRTSVWIGLSLCAVVCASHCAFSGEIPSPAKCMTAPCVRAEFY